MWHCEGVVSILLAIESLRFITLWYNFVFQKSCSPFFRTNLMFLIHKVSLSESFSIDRLTCALDSYAATRSYRCKSSKQASSTRNSVLINSLGIFFCFSSLPVLPKWFWFCAIFPTQVHCSCHIGWHSMFIQPQWKHLLSLFWHMACMVLLRTLQCCSSCGSCGNHQAG